MTETQVEPVTTKVPRRSTARLRLRPGDPERLKPTPKSAEKSAVAEANKVARWSVVVTGLVAVLGAVVTLTVALVTANNTREQAAEEFQREQRQKAYVELVAANDKFGGALRDLWYAHDLQAPFEESKQGQAFVELTAAGREFGLKSSLVHLVSPPDTAMAAADLSDSNIDLQQMVLDRITGGTTPQTQQAFDAGMVRSINLEIDFMSFARKDLD